VRTHDLTFGIGPAGTGKTYLAVACAVEALQSEKVRRIVLVRPAVEAGERLGFLPGDLSQKVDPYLRPMYDALYEMMGFERVAKLIERNVIEVAPLAFMRGRSLNDSFVILDEAQNTTNEQMKMFLTRIGFGSKAVVTGDITQVDLPSAKQSGLRTVIDILRGVRGIAFTMFSSRDVVRHPLVQRIVQAYEATPPTKARDAGRRGRLELDVTYAARRPWAPRRAHSGRWAAARALARAAAARAAALSIRVVGAARSRSLNARYRGKDKADQRAVLCRRRSPARRAQAARRTRDLRAGGRARGACAAQNARALGPHDRSRRAAPARLRSRTRREARKMEKIEVQILDRLGFSNPYA
jgi:hypothetical protein